MGSVSGVRAETAGKGRAGRLITGRASARRVVCTVLHARAAERSRIRVPRRRADRRAGGRWPSDKRDGEGGLLSGSGAKTNVKSLTADYSARAAKSGAQHTQHAAAAAGTSHSAPFIGTRGGCFIIL